MRSPRFPRTAAATAGAVLVGIVVVVALVGPLLAPHPPEGVVGGAGVPPNGDAWLGTDYLGRDVLSRVLWGGISVLILATVATALAFLIGGAVGIVAGYKRGFLDTVLMRSVDVLFAFPALLIILLLTTSLGTSLVAMVLGIILVQLAGIARVVRSAALEASTHDYVDAALARGERTTSVLIHDVVPNIAPIVMADFGVRFGYSVILIASLSFLGVGLQPPAADWGLMISENRQFITLNAWSVVVPAVLIGMLTVGVNLIGDAYVRSLDRSDLLDRRRRLGYHVDGGPVATTELVDG